ncbi:MAG TPA: VOC family protein [Candidatus Polarisedimenticolaceae bacterium]|nr:VOC family protein [Candidatus Polarisedimenticolaceae bacterium]
MSEVTGVLETALYVADMSRSVAFYVNLFGFEIVDADERLTALAVKKGQLLLLCARDASPGLPALTHGASGQQHVAFSITEADLPPWRERLARSRIPIVHERRWPRGGDSIYFRDPDGHLLELATPGVWSAY